MNLARHLRIQWWIIVILVSVLAVFLTTGDFLSRFDNLAYDHLLKLDAAGADSEIVLVEIDDHSLARIGRWPWPREVHAALIDRIGAASPRVISYDTLFTEPSVPAADKKLGAAIARAGSVFLPLFQSDPEQPGGHASVVEPIDDLRSAAAGTGFTDFSVDPDGVVRSALLDLPNLPGRRHLMDRVYRKLEAGVPAGAGPTLIPFAGSDRWQRFHASTVLAGGVPMQALHGKIVLVGVTASGIGQRYPVAGWGTLSGLEIDAQLLRGLLDHRMIGMAGTNARIAFALVPLWLLMLVMGPFGRIPPSLALGGATVLILAFSAGLLLYCRLWLPPASALLALGIAYPVWGWRQLSVTQQFMRRELQRLQADRSIFHRAMPPVRQRALPSTIALLTAAITDNRDMRQFIADRLDQLPDATLVTSAAGEILLANAFARTLFGVQIAGAEPAARLAPLLAHFHEVGTQEPVRFPMDITATSLRYDAMSSDGHFYAIRFVPQQSVSGNFAGWIVQFMDVSEAKAIQRQRDDIVELLTHDMRSPQASILAVLETAPPEAVATEQARRIRHYAERTLGLADGFVQLARAESLEYVLEEVELGDMVIDAIDDLWPQLSAKSISIDTNGTDERLIVNVERSLLTRALINVLGNAVKYSAPGSHIHCTLKREEGGDGMAHAFCAIADQGPGLEAEQMHNIFERFHRGPLGVGKKADGVGLGLSFVHTVLVRHRGEIRCESEPGRGATFTFVLPLAG